MESIFKQVFDSGSQKIRKERAHGIMIHWGWCGFTWLERDLFDEGKCIYAKSGTVINDTLINVTRNIRLEEISPETVSSRGVGIQTMMTVGLYRTLHREQNELYQSLFLNCTRTAHELYLNHT